MTSEPRAPGAAAVILQRRVDRDDDGKAEENNYLRIKVLKEEGRKYGNVELPFYPSTQQIRNIKARTVRPDGSVAAFDGNVYERYLVKARGAKILAKTFTLPDVQVGSILEYSYVVDLKFLDNSQWVLNQDLFTKAATFSLKPPRNSYIPMTVRRTLKDVPSDALPVEGADHVIRMEARNIPAFIEEDYMPPENEVRSRVEFNYLYYHVDSDPDKFWKNIGKQDYDLLEAYVGKRNSSLEEAVRQIASPDDPPELKLRKIYARVQKLRNLSYEPAKTEKEQQREKEKPAKNVQDIWKHGYGNSVELPWLFLALARAAGFEAYGCWVAGRDQYFFNPKLMQPEGLGDNIVIVKLNGKDIYLDPGSPFTPFGMLPWSETSTPGIQLDSTGGTWIRTPLPVSSDSLAQYTARLRLSDSGNLEGSATVTFTGLEAMELKTYLRNDDEARRRKYLEDLFKSQIPIPSTVELTRSLNWTDSEAPLTADFTVKVPNWAEQAGQRVLVPVGLFAAGEKHIFEHRDRIHPIYFDYLYEKIEDVTIDLPAEWLAMGVPGQRSRKADQLFYDMKVEADETKLHVTRQLKVDVFLLEQKYYSILREFFQAVRSNDEEQIVLQPSKAKTN